MRRVSRATFVLSQLSLICTYAYIQLHMHVYMYTYLNDKSQVRHSCLVTAASRMHICLYVHMRGSCDKTKVARLTRYWAVASIVMWIRRRR